MKNCARLTTLTALFSLCLAVSRLSAQDNNKPEAQKPSPSIQEQIDALKEGQQRIFKELEEIKTLLRERPGRVDYPAKPAAPSIIPMNVHGEPFKGDSRARVAVMEYSDFECSFCAKYAREIYPQIDENYIKPGKVKYFFRDLPAPEHPNALAKARAARCAGEQGKFWEMHDRLFSEQAAPAGQDLALDAEALGLDLEKFNECFHFGFSFCFVSFSSKVPGLRQFFMPTR